VRYRLANAVIRAPFDGVVVEGDWRERIASPVKQGDALFKVAKIGTLYAEADISEKDVKEIFGHSSGEIAFVTQPKLKYPVTGGSGGTSGGDEEGWECISGATQAGRRCAGVVAPGYDRLMQNFDGEAVAVLDTDASHRGFSADEIVVVSQRMRNLKPQPLLNLRSPPHPGLLPPGRRGNFGAPLKIR